MLTKNQVVFVRNKFIYLLLPTVVGLGAIAIGSGSTSAALSPTTAKLENSNITPTLSNTQPRTPQLLAQANFMAELLQLTNAERQKVGAPPLKMNDKLTQAAQRHATDMATKNFLSHTGSDGSTMQSRVQATGYLYQALGENVAAGQSTPAAVLKSWMNSSGHRRNILNPNYTEIGIGYAMNSSSRYTHYWTQVFARPR
jgi:uncharacterized protein YkwD